MKKAFIISVALVVTSSNAYAGVSDIRNNGKINGAPSYLVECSSGSDYIIYKKDGTWYRGDIGHMGNKYNSWSKNEVANHVCR